MIPVEIGSRRLIKACLDDVLNVIHACLVISAQGLFMLKESLHKVPAERVLHNFQLRDFRDCFVLSPASRTLLV